MESPSARIVRELRHRIVTGEWRPGDRVPSTRAITQQYGVAMATASKVLATLANEGLVRAQPGVGTVVTDTSPRRPTEPVVTRAAVVRTAIAVADAEGLAAVSMRRIATDLGVATMSLYRHVRSKDELWLAMADTVFAEETLPARSQGTWRERLELAMRLQWRMYRRHPWLAHVISMARPQAAPALLAHAEWALRALADGGFDLDAMMHAHISLFGHVRGIAINIEAEQLLEQDTGISTEDWLDRTNVFTTMLSGGAYPTLARLTTATDLDFDFDTLFEFGMTRLLDGLEVLLTHS